MLIRRVHGPPVAQVGAADETYIHKQVESAVHCGEVKRLAAHLDGGVDFFSGHVLLTVGNRVHDHLSLRGDPAAVLAKFVE